MACNLGAVRLKETRRIFVGGSVCCKDVRVRERGGGLDGGER